MCILYTVAELSHSASVRRYSAGVQMHVHELLCMQAIANYNTRAIILKSHEARLYCMSELDLIPWNLTACKWAVLTGY